MKPIRLPRLRSLLPILALVGFGDDCPSYDPPSLAEATTTSNLGATKVTVAGNITFEGGKKPPGGGEAIVSKGIVYALTADNEDMLGSQESPGGIFFEEDSTGTGPFTINVTGLTPGSDYTYKAIARNRFGVGYSGEGHFTTLALEVTSPTVANVTDTSATLGGEVISDVGGMITERGVVFMPFDDYEIDDEGKDNLVVRPGVTQAVAAGTGTGVFTVDATTGIAAGVDYVFKAYASLGSDDTVYSEASFFPEQTDLTVEVDGTVVSSIAALPDGKTLLGGNFTEIDGEAHSDIVRLNADGTVDSTFIAGVEGFNREVAPGVFQRDPAWLATLAVQNDGKTLIGGQFTVLNGAPANANLARLNVNGSIDTGFLGRVGVGNLECIAIQSDGRILLGGYLIDVNGNTKYEYLGRLNANGSLDTDFNPGIADLGPNANVKSIAVQPSGKILIAGWFNEYSGVARPGFARLNTNGTLDTGFDPLISADNFAVQSDGKILVCGYYPAGTGIRRLEVDGDLDPTFAPATAPDHIAVTNGAIESIAIQADGKILIGGSFTQVNGTPRDHVARLNDNGTLDTTLDPVVGFKASGLALREDGKIVVGGIDDTAVAGTPGDLVVVLANDPPTRSVAKTSTSRVEWMRGGAAPEVSSVIFESSTNNGATWTLLGPGTRIAGGWELTGLSLPGSEDIRARGRSSGGKYNSSSGLVEQSTISGPPAGTAPTVITRTQANILVTSATLGGNVTSEGDSGVTERGVVLSRTFDNEDPRIGGARVRKLTSAGTTGAFTVDVSGLVLGTSYSFRAYATNNAGTGYTTVGEFKTIGLPRIETPTATDGGGFFSLGAKITHHGGGSIIKQGVIYSPRLASSERLLTKENGIDLVASSAGVGHFSVPAILDPATDYVFVAYATNAAGTSYTSPVSKFTTPGPSQPENGSPGGEGTGSGSLPEGGPLSSADLDAGFDTEIEAGGLVQVLAEQADGKILVAGKFATEVAPLRIDLARLNVDGSVDATFNASTDGAVYSVLVQSDGRILLGGLFSRVNGSTRTGVARLEADGTLESALTFSPALGTDNTVYAMALQPDGRILIGGLFTSVHGVTRNRIARLEANGELDPGFVAGAGLDDAVYTMALQPDGKVIVGGMFENAGGSPRSRIARFHGDGSLDTGFDPGSGANDRITSLALQGDGRVLVGGYFTNFNGASNGRITRLTANGGLDTSFNTGTGANDLLYSMALQTDGRILVGGLFQNINGTARNRIARLNANGSVDTTFDPGTGADDEVDAVALTEDGSILLGGLFQFVDGVARNGIARLDNDVATQSLTAVDGTQLTWLRGGAGPEVLPVNFEISTDAGITWTGLGAGTRVAGGWSITGQDLPVNGLVRALGRTAGGFLGGSAGIVEESVGYDHQARIDALRARLAAANANVAKLQAQIKAAKKKKNKAKAKKLTTSLKTAMAQVASANADLAKYP